MFSSSQRDVSFKKDFIIIFYIMSMLGYIHMSAVFKSVRSPAAGVTEGCEPSNVGAGN